MIPIITEVVYRIIHSRRLEAFEKKVLDKYESFVVPPVVNEPAKEKETPVVEQV